MSDHILFAYQMSGPSKGHPLTTEAEIVEALRHPDLAWLRLQADHPAARGWIAEHLSFLNPVITEALVAEETRPRASVIDDGLLMILRGVNTNPGADPDDMVSVRLWVDSARIVSLSRRQLASVHDIQSALSAGHGPTRAGEFVCALVSRLNERIESYLRSLDDETDALEEELIAEQTADLHARITDTRRQVVAFRRHVGPQRDALDRLAHQALDLLDASDQLLLRDAHERLVRTVEDLDAMRDRLNVVKDEIANAQAERLNRNLYILSLVSAVFLPLGFLTGLMGINLGGMPGAGHPGAFWVFSGSLVGIAVLLLIVLRRMRMF